MLTEVGNRILRDLSGSKRNNLSNSEVFSSYLAGLLLAAIQGSVPTGYNPLPVWAYANQMTQVINLIAYGSAGCLLNIIGYQTFGGIMVGLLIFMILRSPNFSKNTIHRDLDLYG